MVPEPFVAPAGVRSGQPRRVRSYAARGAYLLLLRVTNSYLPTFSRQSKLTSLLQFLSGLAE